MAETRRGGAVVAQAGVGAPPSGRRRRGAAGSPNPGWIRRLRDPRSVVLLLLGLVVLIGGGRKLARARRGFRAVGRLDDPDVSPAEIEAAAEYGRVGLFELFRILGTAERPDQRAAAGRAIARLWADDQLVAEEEQAFVRRGFEVDWQARRRYPRALSGAVPIAVEYGVPILSQSQSRSGPGAPRGVAPENLEWSHRISGANRSALEEETPWKPGPGRVEFTIIPDDYESNGPHSIVLSTQVRTVGLTDAWTLEPPRARFQFEFDPLLATDSLLTLPDEHRAEIVGRSIRLEPPPRSEGSGAAAPARSAPLPIHDGLVIRNPPVIVVDVPLPCDLAHQIEVEIEGVDGWFTAGRLILSGQGAPRTSSADTSDRSRSVRIFPLGPITGIDESKLDRPGRQRLRIRLTADAALGWGDPAIRSIWPGEVVTPWIDVEIGRR